ncbi:hypothetical protein GCM10010466_63370 [Planomonospora alba]|uniref:CopC domain-containing protein n=1 Tax=Planomonospora alba TaxID=161354 RepID=A0ABP6P109_9ACTN
MRRLLTVLLLACAALLGAVAPAQAHNVLIGSDPKDGAELATGPEEITLTFDQPARQGFAQISLTGPDGARWEDGKTSVDGAEVSVRVRPLGPAGKYVVGYRILSSDGHPVSGKVTFTLTAPGPGAAAPSPSASSAGDAGAGPGADAGADSTGASAAASPGQSAPAAPPGAAAPAPSGPAGREQAPGLSAQAAEAAQNGGAGMAVVWIAAALVLLGGATVVAMRRTRGQADAS